MHFRGFGTKRAILGTFRGFGTERARLGTLRGFGTERARLGFLIKILKSLEMSNHVHKCFFLKVLEKIQNRPKKKFLTRNFTKFVNP